ncbi:inner centromere protein [Sigmodon hispidus]
MHTSMTPLGVLIHIPVPPSHPLQEKEHQQRLENMWQKEKAEHLHRQKLEEDKQWQLEEVKMKHEEHFCKVLQACEQVEQMKEEKKKKIEQMLALNDKKKEMAKQE